MWKTLNEVRIPDILQFVQEASQDGQAVHIGTDSLQTGRLTQFVTVVVILTPRKGGRVAYRREVVPRITSLRERLLKEVWKSVDLGLQFSPLVKGDLTVHIDANPVVAHKSSAVRPGARRAGGRPGLQGAHQAGELGCVACRGPRGSHAGEAARALGVEEGMRMESGHVGSVVRPPRQGGRAVRRWPAKPVSGVRLPAGRCLRAAALEVRVLRAANQTVQAATWPRKS